MINQIKEVEKPKYNCVICKKGRWNHAPNDGYRPSFAGCSFRDSQDEVVESDCEGYIPMGAGAMNLALESMARFDKDGVKKVR